MGDVSYRASCTCELRNRNFCLPRWPGVYYLFFFLLSERDSDNPFTRVTSVLSSTTAGTLVSPVKSAIIDVKLAQVIAPL